MEQIDVGGGGGGLAGLAAVYGLAREGLEVMLLERGDYVGAKNVSGGRLYTSLIYDLHPELWAQAPLECVVAHERLSLVAEGRLATLEIAAQDFSAPRSQSYTVVRARFDAWLAEKAAEAGRWSSPRCRSMHY